MKWQVKIVKLPCSKVIQYIAVYSFNKTQRESLLQIELMIKRFQELFVLFQGLVPGIFI